MDEKKYAQGIVSVELSASELKILNIYFGNGFEAGPLPIDLDGAVKKKLEAAMSESLKEKVALEFNLVNQNELPLAIGLPIICRIVAKGLADYASMIGQVCEKADGIDSVKKGLVAMELTAADLLAMAFCLEEEFLSAAIPVRQEAKKNAAGLIRNAVADKSGRHVVSVKFDLGDDENLLFLEAAREAAKATAAALLVVAAKFGEMMKTVILVEPANQEE